MTQPEYKLCPCDSGRDYRACCLPVLTGEQRAASPEALMRSRYAAFATQNVAYLLSSHAPETLPPGQSRQLQANIASVKWLALHIMARQSPPFDPEGAWVEFIAFYRQGEELQQLHEKSFFVLRHQQWFYLEGNQLPPRAWQRNEPCWCRSGKKTKKCHG